MRWNLFTKKEEVTEEEVPEKMRKLSVWDKIFIFVIVELLYIVFSVYIIKTLLKVL